MSYSQETLIQKIYALLEIQHDFFSAITGTINSSVTTVGVTDGTEWAIGDVLEFQPDGELARVRGISTNDLTIIRGAFGTTAAAHTNGDSVVKNPSVPRQTVKDSIEAVFQEVWPLAWKTDTVAITPANNTEWYDTASDIVDLVSAYQVYTPAAVDKLGIYGDKGGEKPIIFSKNLPSALVTSGKGIGFPGGLYDASTDIEVTYRTQLLGTVNTGSYTEISAGIAVEVIAYGAATRIAMGKESPKTLLEDQAMGEHNTASGDRLALATFLDNKYRRALNQWSELLWLESPPMGTVK